MASSSWKAPRETRFVSEEPARRSRGKALTFALPIYVNTISPGRLLEKQLNSVTMGCNRIDSYP